MKYRVIDHWDIWGNEQDGYEINGSTDIGEIELEATNVSAIIQTLINKCFLGDFPHDKFLVLGSESYIQVYSSEGLPLYSLARCIE